MRKDEEKNLLKETFRQGRCGSCGKKWNSYDNFDEFLTEMVNKGVFQTKETIEALGVVLNLTKYRRQNK